MIIPTQRLFISLFGIAFLALLSSIWPFFTSIWWGSIALLGGVILLDIIQVYRPLHLHIQRKISASLPVGVSRLVTLIVENQSPRSYQLTVFDHHPPAIQAHDLPIKLRIAAHKNARFSYPIQALQRGKMQFRKVQVHVLSPLGLFIRDLKLPVLSEVRVYPNFAAVSQYALLATDNKLSQLGIIKKRRRGEGQDFHQLRAYRRGDALRQIDWKASSRMRKVISREYQDERDQDVIFLLDCGHRMQAKDDALSHFDHTLNAILLLAYVALKQGDAVGLATFGGVSHWCAPRKGQQVIQHLLNTVYDIEPTTLAPDYSQMVTELMLRHKKRALIILITNLRDEDSDDLLPALQLLKKRHLVLLANMREQALDVALEQTVSDHQDALLWAATQRYMQHRQQTFDKISQTHVLSLDVIPQALSTGLINHYLDIKRSGIL